MKNCNENIRKKVNKKMGKVVPMGYNNDEHHNEHFYEVDLKLRDMMNDIMRTIHIKLIKEFKRQHLLLYYV